MLADLIPKLAAMEQDEDHPYYPRPSMASPSTADDPGRCVRAMIYHRLGTAPAPWPGRFLLVLDDSAWHEELTLDWLRKSAYQIHSTQLPIDYNLPSPIGRGGFCAACQQPIPNTVLHGHIDALFTDLLGITRLCEHKAVNRYRYDALLNGELPLDYVTQCCIYLGAVQGLNINMGPRPEAVLLVKNKDTAAYLEFVLTFDPTADRCTVLSLDASDGTRRTLNLTLDGLVTGAIDKFRQVEASAERQALPARPYRQDSWRCDYCRYGARCWGGYAAEVAGREPHAELPDAVAPLLASYAHAGSIKSDCEATMKRLRPRILVALEAANTRRGAGGGYLATVSIQDRASLDQSLIPADVKAAATVTKPVEILRVTAVAHHDDAH